MAKKGKIQGRASKQKKQEGMHMMNGHMMKDSEMPKKMPKPALGKRSGPGKMMAKPKKRK